jgi:aspartyl-tRNA synthetase
MEGFPLSSSVLPTAYRSHSCGDLRLGHVGECVKLSGWVQTTRDFGHFIFIDLRDRYGITQLTVPANSSLYGIAKTLGREFVVQATGVVKERENKNPNLATGDVEVYPDTLNILRPAALPPFKVENETDGSEELRLTYRYLDLRRPALRDALLMRHRIAQATRDYLNQQGFCEIETPVLIKSTPEGARDFIVPSRLHPGSFYALPQSPQILKQLLMVAGMDRYYQICKCFRDEDFRGDRQPEFTQIDCEMAFVEQDDVLHLCEGLIRHIFRSSIGVELPALPRLTYSHCIETYGSDKPDLRFGMPIVTLTEQATGLAFPPFAEAIASGGLVAGLCVPGAAEWTRKQLDAAVAFVKEPHRGLKGLLSIKIGSDGSLKSSADKFLTPEDLAKLAQPFAEAQPGDLILIASDTPGKVRRSLGELRLDLGKSLGLIPANAWSVFFVVDFPMFERDEESGALMPVHHPFVMPNPQDWPLVQQTPEAVRALCYDMVINGNEVMSGSIRIHQSDIQDQVFGFLGLSEAEKQEKFGFLLKAFDYGAPPHGGWAFGLDRLVMLLCGGQTIRDVMAFPKNSSGRDLMLEAPAAVPAEALDLAHIQLKPM